MWLRLLFWLNVVVVVVPVVVFAAFLLIPSFYPFILIILNILLVFSAAYIYFFLSLSSTLFQLFFASYINCDLILLIAILQEHNKGLWCLPTASSCSRSGILHQLDKYNWASWLRLKDALTMCYWQDYFLG